MRLNMEMYAFNIRGLALSSFHYACGAFDGLYGRVRAWLKGADRSGLRTEAEKRAEIARQNYGSQALASTWQASRYFR
jgi:hypothetical protein